MTHNEGAMFLQIDLLRYVSGEASAESRQAIERWMATDPRNRSEVELLQRAWSLSARSAWTDQEVRSLWGGLQQRIACEDGVARHTAPPTILRTSTPRLTLVRTPRKARWTSPAGWGIAAALVVAAGATFLLRGVGAPGEAASLVMRTVATQAGQRTELRLADGTIVKLDAASMLRAPATFQGGSYDVYLAGAAYFEVAHDSTRIFRVHTAHGVTEDLGTRFAISAYATDSAESVAVADGSVMLHGAVGDPVALQAGDVGRLSASGVFSVARHVNVSRYFDEIDGLLEFDNVALRDAVPALERQFDIQIRLRDTSLAKKRFTASFTAGDVDQLMNGLAFLLDARYERPGRGRVLILSPR
ncbi:MAG TPA: FecR domain-containing protein [Gemmatimonadaceae bacterium]